jgi:hypothetical protein
MAIVVSGDVSEQYMALELHPGIMIQTHSRHILQMITPILPGIFGPAFMSSHFACPRTAPARKAFLAI